MASQTGATVVVPIYPLVQQGGTAGVVVPKVANLISTEIAAHGAPHVSVLGDSAGGTIGLAAVEYLVATNQAVPASMVLLSPALDLTASNPAIGLVNAPFLGGPAALGATQQIGKEWAGGLSMTNPLVSPLDGSLKGLPPTYVYAGSLDPVAPMCSSCSTKPSPKERRSASHWSMANSTTGCSCPRTGCATGRRSTGNSVPDGERDRSIGGNDHGGNRFGDDRFRSQPAGRRSPDRRLTGTSGIATATWRDRLASRGISRGPKQCHDTTFRGYPNGMLAEIRQYNMLISQTLARIKIDFDSAATPT